MPLVVTAVSVGSGLAVHAVLGQHPRAALTRPDLDTMCGAVERGRSRNPRGRPPVLHPASTGYGITCRACLRSIG